METRNGTPRKRHVLIVDDDVPLAWSFKKMLERRGYDATIVPDGALALRFILQHALDAVVCDLQVSRLEGDLLYSAVERSDPTLARRFVFITSVAADAPQRKFLETAHRPVLQKPVVLESLLDEVVRVAEQR